MMFGLKLMDMQNPRTPKKPRAKKGVKIDEEVTIMPDTVLVRELYLD